MSRRAHHSAALAAALLLAALVCPRAAPAADARASDAAPAADARADGRPDAGLAAGADASGAMEASAAGPAGDAARAPALPAWAPKLSATVKPVVVALGDPVTVTIKVVAQAGVSATLPLRLELGQLAELSRKESTRALGHPPSSAGRELTFVLQVAAYELGEVTLPPIEITALGPQGELLALKTAAVPLQIKSLMANEPKPQLKALAPAVAVFQRDWLLLYAIVGLGAAGLIVLATLAISRKLRARREAQRPPPPPVPAHVIALGRLAALDVEQHIAAERYKELYIALSEIIRGYVGGRFGFDALEMTTAEIRAALVGLRVAADTQSRVDALLDAWDLVKFAKYRPEAEAARAAKIEAEALVRATMSEAPAPATAPDAAGAR